MKIRIEIEDGDTRSWVEHECTPLTAYDTCGWLMASILTQAQAKLTLKQRMALLPWNDDVIYFGTLQ